MNLVTRYITSHSNGKDSPICGSRIAKAMGISSVEVRKLINQARTDGDPICSNGRGYYIAGNRDELLQTIESMRGRISVMNNAVSGLEQALRGA